MRSLVPGHGRSAGLSPCVFLGLREGLGIDFGNEKAPIANCIVTVTAYDKHELCTRFANNNNDTVVASIFGYQFAKGEKGIHPFEWLKSAGTDVATAWLGCWQRLGAILSIALFSRKTE